MKFELLSAKKENGRITAIYKNRITGGTFIVQHESKQGRG